ncbi:MAG: DUF695 domain-containing protein [Planctomycetota bacterium]
MSGWWDLYFCHIDDKPAEISLDLEVAESAPLPDLPHRIGLRVPMRSPRPDGLPSNGEGPTLRAIEDALHAAAGSGEVAMRLVGRLTWDGNRDFCFYAADGDRGATLLQRTLARFPLYRVGVRAVPDPQWSTYFEFFFPRDTILQRLKNRRCLESFHLHQDREEVVREVRHRIVVPSVEARDELVKIATFYLYREHERGETNEAALPFFVVFAKAIDLAPRSVDLATYEMMRFAERHGGRYDGWESEVRP